MADAEPISTYHPGKPRGQFADSRPFDGGVLDIREVRQILEIRSRQVVRRQHSLPDHIVVTVAGVIGYLCVSPVAQLIMQGSDISDLGALIVVIVFAKIRGFETLNVNLLA